MKELELGLWMALTGMIRGQAGFSVSDVLLNPQVSVHHIAEVDERFEDPLYPHKYENFIRLAYANGQSSANALVENTTVHMKWIQTMLNGEEHLDQGVFPCSCKAHRRGIGPAR